MYVKLFKETGNQDEALWFNISLHLSDCDFNQSYVDLYYLLVSLVSNDSLFFCLFSFVSICTLYQEWTLKKKKGMIFLLTWIFYHHLTLAILGIIKAYNLQTIKKLLQPYIIWGNGNHIVVSLGSYVHFTIYWICFRHNQGIPNAIPDINISCNTWPTDFRFKTLRLINLKCNSLSKQTIKHHPSVSLY